MGDINADFARDSQFTKYIHEFISDNSLQRSWEKHSVDFTHAYDIDNKTYTSTIDHFFWSENLSTNIRDAGVLHVPSNTSDHCPIFCIVDVTLNTVVSSTEKKPVTENKLAERNGRRKIRF